MMYTFTDRGGRNLVLAPEYTVLVQKLASTRFKQDKDLKLFYVQECFRGERSQKGRYRQFTQLGVEILNPTKDHTEDLIKLGLELMKDYPITIKDNVVRGLDYYNGSTFELEYEGSNLSVCGGGAYELGIGFSIGLDRLLTLNEK